MGTEWECQFDQFYKKQSVTGTVSGLPVKQQDQVISAGEALVWLWPLVVPHFTHPRNDTATAWSLDVWMAFCTQDAEANPDSPSGSEAKFRSCLSVFFIRFFLQHFSGK